MLEIPFGGTDFKFEKQTKFCNFEEDVFTNDLGTNKQV